MKKICVLILAFIFVFLTATTAFADFEWPIQINIDDTGFEIDYMYLVPEFTIDNNVDGNFLYNILEPIVSWAMNLESPLRYFVVIPLYPLIMLVPVYN